MMLQSINSDSGITELKEFSTIAKTMLTYGDAIPQN